MRLKYSIPNNEKIALSYRPIDNGNSINERERMYFKQAGEKNRAQRHLRALIERRQKPIAFYNAKDFLTWLYIK